VEALTSRKRNTVPLFALPARARQKSRTDDHIVPSAHRVRYRTPMPPPCCGGSAYAYIKVEYDISNYEKWAFYVEISSRKSSKFPCQFRCRPQKIPLPDWLNRMHPRS
jgi:hypothetical protein